MARIRPEQLTSGSYNITGSFTGSFIGDGSGLTDLNFNTFPYIGDAVITRSLEVVGTGQDLFLIKDQANNPLFTVSQSGVVVLSTQSIELSSPAPNEGLYFTSSSFFVGLD